VNTKEALEFIEAEKVNKLTESESSLGRLKEALAHKTIEFENLVEKYETEGIALKEKEIELCEEYEEKLEQMKNLHQKEVEATSSKTREEFLSHITSLESQLSSVDEMKAQLSRHQQFEEQLFMENSKLKEALMSAKESKPVVNHQELEEMRRQHDATVTRLREELGNKNIELASLRVDVERGELQIKKRCDVLQADLEYEKSVNARLTQEIRRNQSTAMDTTCFGLGGSKPQARAASAQSSAASTNTSMATSSSSASSDSPVWSSGSGALKEIRLHDAEMKVKSLEKDNSRLKEHEEFYINKAREWKNRALKYERTLEKHGVPVPSRADRNNAANTNKENNAAGNVEEVAASKDVSRDTTKEMNAPGTPTDTINIVLTQKQEPRRTEADFRLPEASRKKQQGDDCKTQ